MSTVRLRRLQADYEKLRAFLAQQPRIRLIQAQGAPPERYQLEFQINGLREVDDQLQTVANHLVEISLPLSYPRLPPQCRMLTPVFHPNIAPHAICIGDHWSAGEPLWSMVARIGETIAYQSYNTKSPLNGEAARWVEANQDRLPLDRTNFVMDDRLPPSAATDRSIIPLAEGPAASPQPAAMAPPPPPPAVAPAPRPPSSLPFTLPPQLEKTPAAPNIVIECGRCRSRYTVPPTAAGRKVRCKKCQAILVISARQSPP
ncbi:MAG: ubiquitin-conjugating enzyme E2 [Thermoguttaceae bacterium]